MQKKKINLVKRNEGIPVRVDLECWWGWGGGVRFARCDCSDRPR